MRSTTLLTLSLLLPLVFAAPATSEDAFAEIRRLIDAEEFDGAKQALKLLPAALRASAEGLLLEATVEHMAGDLASSLRLVQASLERDPRNADAYVLFGLNVSRLGEPELAAGHLEAATRLRRTTCEPGITTVLIGWR
jgi:thioredoxin-like negative regulator of GroEL